VMRRNISTASTASHIVICYLYTVIMQCLSPLLTHTRACYTYAIHFMRSSVHNILYYMMIHSILPSILPDGCTQCDGSRCSFGGSPGGGQQRCGQMCRNNPNICNSATGKSSTNGVSIWRSNTHAHSATSTSREYSRVFVSFVCFRFVCMNTYRWVPCLQWIHLHQWRSSHLRHILLQ
jgi:hypothetical protein